jgi:hypothetical protein
MRSSRHKLRLNEQTLLADVLRHVGATLEELGDMIEGEDTPRMLWVKLVAIKGELERATRIVESLLSYLKEDTPGDPKGS